MQIGVRRYFRAMGLNFGILLTAGSTPVKLKHVNQRTTYLKLQTPIVAKQ